MLVRLPLLLLLALSLATSQTSHAHSGGLDANGCHAGSQPYHCHRAPSEMVGNRLRCDLGSRSKDCLASSEASKADPPIRQATSSASSGNSTSPRTRSFKDEYNRHLKIKNGKCGDKGLWTVDAINMNDVGWRWAWTVYTEDTDGDPLESHTDASYFYPKQRRPISLGIPCSSDWGDLRMSFQVQQF